MKMALVPLGGVMGGLLYSIRPYLKVTVYFLGGSLYGGLKLII